MEFLYVACWYSHSNTVYYQEQTKCLRLATCNLSQLRAHKLFGIVLLQLVRPRSFIYETRSVCWCFLLSGGHTRLWRGLMIRVRFVRKNHFSERGKKWNLHINEKVCIFSVLCWILVCKIQLHCCGKQPEGSGELTCGRPTLDIVDLSNWSRLFSPVFIMANIYS